MAAPQGMRQVNPGGDPALWIFHGSDGNDGICGLAVSRDGAAPESATLLASRDAYTQRVMAEMFAAGALYEPSTSLIALGCLRPGDIALDVGAHIGYFAILFRLGVGAGGTVFAFEPMPGTYRRLLRNVMLNRFTNVLPLPLALADRSGTAMFYLHPENEGESSLIGAHGGESCQVQVSCLDDLFRDGMAQRPRLMKMDAEGVEASILAGGRRWFDDHAPDLVISEINRGALANAGSSEEEVRRFFRERGYRCAVIGSHGIDLQGGHFYRYLNDEGPAAPDCPYVFNLMFVRDGSGLYPDPVM